MKALKVFLTIMLGIAMFILIGTFGVLTASRILLSGDNIGNIAKDIVKESGKLNFGDFIDSKEEITTEELTEAISEMEEYIDVDDLYDEFGNFTSQVLRYAAGASDEIETKDLKKAIKKFAKKYEEKTGEEINLDNIDEELDNAVKEIKQDMKQMDPDSKQALEILGVAYNNKIYYGVLIGILVCGALIVLINQSLVPLCIVTLVISILGLLANGAIALLTKLIPIDGDLISKVILSNVTGVFAKLVLIFIVIIVLSIVGIVVGKKIKKPEVITT